MRPACTVCGRRVGHELDCTAWAAELANMPRTWDGDNA